MGHYARDCDERKGDTALYTATEDIDVDDEDQGEYAFITVDELVLFSR